MFQTKHHSPRDVDYQTFLHVEKTDSATQVTNIIEIDYIPDLTPITDTDASFENQLASGMLSQSFVTPSNMNIIDKLHETM